jgi:ankyrin repeat protein
VAGCPAEDEENVVAMARLLLDAGAGINNRRRDGLTALHTAGYRGHSEVARLLLARGADPAIRGHQSGDAHAGASAAEMAYEQGHFETAMLIRAAGG